MQHDKLTALSGLVRIIAERTKDKYFAGLWMRHLFKELFWIGEVKNENEAYVGKADECRAPL
jgi:hypothetical protein